MDQYIGKMLDNRYEILELIGSGGMANVYKAKCHRLNRMVAVKILKNDLAENADFRRRFRDESLAVAQLSHANIVSVYDVSRSGDTEYIVMELVDGITLKLPWKDELMFILIGITGGSFYFFLQNTASAHTSAANVSILVSMSPILTVILAQLFSRRGEKLGKWVYIGAVVAIAGVVMVVLNGTLSFHLSPLGDLLALAAALMWAVYSILVKKYTERYDNFLVTRRVFLWAFLTSLPLVLLTDGLPSLTPLFTQPNILVSWLFLGVFGNAVCFAIWNIAFKRLGVVITNNYLYATPFVTVVAGWLLLGEKISLMCIIGAVLITLGVIFAGKSDS